MDYHFMYNNQLTITNQLQQRVNSYIQSEGRLKVEIIQLRGEREREEKENSLIVNALHRQLATLKSALPQDTQRMLAEIETLQQRNMLMSAELAGYKKREEESKKAAEAEKLKLAEAQKAKEQPSPPAPITAQVKAPSGRGLKIAFFGFCAVVVGGIYYLKSLGML